jgi:hypothetical protein
VTDSNEHFSKLVFVPAKDTEAFHFHTCLMFASKARSQPLECSAALPVNIRLGFK